MQQLLQQNAHPMELRYNWHELQQFIEAILNDHLVLASIKNVNYETPRERSLSLERVTERMLYVLPVVHSTASSSGPPFIVRLKHISEIVEYCSLDHVSAYLRSSGDD